MLKFKFILKVKDCDMRFHPDMPPGVLVIQDVSYNDASEEDLNNPMFSQAVLCTQDELIEQYIEVKVERVK